jgi:hypothetical protein
MSLTSSHRTEHVEYGPDLGGPVVVDLVDRQIRAAVDLLRRTYHPVDDQHGGWYHDLTNAPPGPVATALALLAFRLAGQRFASADQCWAFLRDRQIVSRDPLRGGGWASNTTAAQPTVEATAVVVRLLGDGSYGFAGFAPDAASAVAFLANHQNDDGGWGSLRGNPSRTVVTTEALLALVSLCPDHPAIDSGIRWLMTHQAPAGGWGETPASPSTVAHSSLALQALVRCRADLVDAGAAARAYEWLTSRLSTDTGAEIHVHVETYNIITTAKARQRTVQWRETMHHHGLALAASALLRHPDRLPAAALRHALAVILRTQQPTGTWADADHSPAPALWPTWYCLAALLDLRHADLLRAGDTLVWLDHATVIRHASAGSRDLTALVASPRRRRLAAFIRRRWGSLVLALGVLVSIAVAATGLVAWSTALLGLLLPVSLFVLQEATAGLRRS